MEKVLMRDCGDGFRRANAGSFSPVVAKTASYTIQAAEAGSTFSNAGAGGAITFTLPAPASGTFFRFLRHAAQNVTVTATGGAKINGGSANGSYTLHGGTAPGGLRNVTFWSDGTDWFISAPTALKFFISTEQTGNGSSQDIAHGLGVTPLAVLAACTDDSPTTAGVFTVTEGTHDATNVKVTVTNNKKYKVFAIA